MDAGHPRYRLATIEECLFTPACKSGAPMDPMWRCPGCQGDGARAVVTDIEITEIAVGVDRDTGVPVTVYRGTPNQGTLNR